MLGVLSSQITQQACHRQSAGTFMPFMPMHFTARGMTLLPDSLNARSQASSPAEFQHDERATAREWHEEPVAALHLCQLCFPSLRNALCSTEFR